MSPTVPDAIRRLGGEFGTSPVFIAQAGNGVLIGDRTEGTVIHQPATRLRPTRDAGVRAMLSPQVFFQGFGRG